MATRNVSPHHHPYAHARSVRRGQRPSGPAELSGESEVTRPSLRRSTRLIKPTSPIEAPPEANSSVTPQLGPGAEANTQAPVTPANLVAPRGRQSKSKTAAARNEAWNDQGSSLTASQPLPETTGRRLRSSSRREQQSNLQQGQGQPAQDESRVLVTLPVSSLAVQKGTKRKATREDDESQTEEEAVLKKRRTPTLCGDLNQFVDAVRRLFIYFHPFWGLSLFLRVYINLPFTIHSLSYILSSHRLNGLSGQNARRRKQELPLLLARANPSLRRLSMPLQSPLLTSMSKPPPLRLRLPPRWRRR